jgi:hypothetical protein
MSLNMQVNPNSATDRQRSTQMDRLGGLIAHRLRETPVSPDVQERLRVAREQALAAARQRLASTDHEPRGWWQRTKARWAQKPAQWWNVVAVSAGVAAFAISFVAVQLVNEARETSELAEVDTQLLTDDIPPEAYSDPAFMRFLRNSSENDLK